jgi:hypothetical protein
LVERVALGVARGFSLAAAARAAGVPDRTARDWAATPEFKQTVKRLRESIVAQAVGHLSRLAVKAARRLGRLTDHPDPDVALKASVALLDKAGAALDRHDLAERLAALEARAAAGPRVGSHGR